MSLGERLKNLRKSKKWTLKEVAKKLGLSGHSTYSNWEYDRTEPDLDMLKKIAELYDVEVSYLLTGEDEIDYTYDLKDLLKGKNLTFEGKRLTESQKDQAIDILNIILKDMKDTN